MMRLAVLLLLLASTAFSSSPLIMKHADNLNVARTRGILNLQGSVFFVHDSIEFRTEYATWNKDAEMVTCNGGFLFTHPSGYIQAQEGIYQKKNSMATARGDVNAGDSTNWSAGWASTFRSPSLVRIPTRPPTWASSGESLLAVSGISR